MAKKKYIGQPIGYNEMIQSLIFQRDNHNKMIKKLQDKIENCRHQMNFLQNKIKEYKQALSSHNKDKEQIRKDFGLVWDKELKKYIKKEG
ncbi:MAG: hypothetical protein AABY22_33445 [Nanoarchaeota archaeon]